MKRRNRLLSALLSCLLLFSLFSTTALATEDEESPDDSQAKTPVVVSSLEELQAAIAAAEDGDTIALGDSINITENCIVGDNEKQISIVPLDETVKEYFSICGGNANDIVFQNLTIDGENLPCICAIDVHTNRKDGESANLTLQNVTVQNVASTWIPVSIMATSAEIKNCHFTNNTGHLSGGVRVGATAYAKITDSTFYSNKSNGFGGAINCQGELEISNCTIKGNEAAYEETMSYTGGGIHVTGTANITSCTITENIATLGGGVAAHGKTIITDTAIYENIGKNGADDVRVATGISFSMSYTESMDSVYTELKISPSDSIKTIWETALTQAQTPFSSVKSLTVKSTALILVQSLSLHLSSLKNPTNRKLPKKHRQRPHAPLILDTIILRRT